MFTNDPINLWQHVHGASSHFPIALLIFAWLFDVGGTTLRRPEWRVIGFWALFIGAAMTVPAALSGLTALYGWFGYDKWSAASLLTHRTVALIGGGFSIALSLWRIVRRDKLADVEWMLYLVALSATVLLIGYAGYLGGYVAQGA